jgi:hypothetical protein
MSVNGLYTIPVMDAIRHDYERFQFDTHQYSHKGLFTDGESLFAVVLDVKNNQALLDSLKEQYHRFHTLGIPTAILVGDVQEHYQRIESRSSLEKSHLYGQPMNMDETINQLIMHIPRKYHPFHVDFLFSTNEFKLTFKNNIVINDQDEIQLICESLGYQGYDYIFEFNPDMADYPGKVEHNSNTHNNMQLAASGLIQKQFSNLLLERYEEDEDFWIRNRQSVFDGKQTEQRDRFLLPSFESNRTRCFVDASAFPRQNLRVYLTLYEQIVIAPPLNDDADYFYRMFMIRPFELRELIARGRLLFVLPQNLNRYAPQLILEIISVDPNAVIFSRRLAAATIQGIQKKSGIIGTTFSSDEQLDFLHHCSRIKHPEIQRLANTLSEQWQFGEFLVNKEGAVSAHRLGISNLAIKGFQSRGKDLAIELTAASSSFEFAQGLGAHHFPFDGDSYSEVTACQVVSGLYNGVALNTQKIRESELSMLLSEVLAINNDMNILELDDVLGRSQIRSIPQILSEFANISESERLEKVYLLRKELKQIENNKARLTSLDLAGYGLPAGAGALMECADQAGGGYVALGGWMLKMLTTYASETSLMDSPIFTKLSGINHRVSQDAIIVKRVRDSVSKIT